MSMATEAQKRYGRRKRQEQRDGDVPPLVKSRRWFRFV